MHNAVQDYHNTILAGILSKTGQPPGTYTKIRIAPERLPRMLTGARFAIEYSAVDDGMITVTARKDA